MFYNFCDMKFVIKFFWVFDIKKKCDIILNSL